NISNLQVERGFTLPCIILRWPSDYADQLCHVGLLCGGRRGDWCSGDLYIGRIQLLERVAAIRPEHVKYAIRVGCQAGIMARPEIAVFIEADIKPRPRDFLAVLAYGCFLEEFKLHPNFVSVELIDFGLGWQSVIKVGAGIPSIDARI